MGIIRKFECPSCHGQWKVSVGHGMMHGTLDKVLRVFPADIQQKILEDVNGERTPFFNFNFRAAACPRCRDIVAVPVMYLHRTNQTYASGCSECGGRVVIPEDDSKLLCPRCQKERLLPQDVGQWD